MCAARQRGLENLGRVFNQLRRSEKWGHHLSSHPIFKIWGDVVGEAVAEVARPVSFKRGILRVEVSDPAWIQELHLIQDYFFFSFFWCEFNRNIRKDRMTLVWF